MRSTSSLRNWLETTNPDLFHFPAGNFLTSSVFIVYPVSVNSVRRNMLAGMADNVLKPLMLGRGVDAPMPVILLGALGGMASAGILGMFVGATLLAVGYQTFMTWVASSEDNDPAAPKNEPGDSKPTN